jgi:hypothetical protein
MKTFVDSLRAQVSKNGRQRLQKLGLTLEDLEDIPGGELAVAAIEAEPGRLATVLVVDTTGHESEAEKLVERITARLVERKASAITISGAPPQLTAYLLPDDTQDDRVPKNRRVAFAVAPHALVVGDDPVQVGQAFGVLATGRKDSLASVAAFGAVQSPCREALPQAVAPLRWFVDPLAFAKAYQTTSPPREKRKGPDYVAILGRQGFDAVKSVGGVVAFGEAGHSVRHHTFIHAPPLPGREPQSAECYDLAARMLRFPNADSLAPPSWVPRDVSGWTTLQWDMQAAFASAESLVDDVVGDHGHLRLHRAPRHRQRAARDRDRGRRRGPRGRDDRQGHGGGQRHAADRGPRPQGLGADRSLGRSAEARRRLRRGRPAPHRGGAAQSR